METKLPQFAESKGRNSARLADEGCAARSRWSRTLSDLNYKGPELEKTRAFVHGEKAVVVLDSLRVTDIRRGK